MEANDIVLYFSIFIGFRYEVGGDWINYKIFFYEYSESIDLSLIKNFGVDFIITKKFDKIFSRTKSINFIKNILSQKLEAKFIFVSSNFRFGNKREGDVKFLIQNEKKYDYKVIQPKPFLIDRKIVSSSLIRNCLEKAPGCKVVDETKDGGYITPVESSGDFITYISRIRDDQTQKNSINMWVVSDNLLKGAALNTVQIANVLIKKYIN